MTARMVLASVTMTCVLALPALASGTGKIQQYFSETATRVNATEDPAQKRAILNRSFQTMERALEAVQGSSTISGDDRAGIDRLKASLRDKQDELAGVNGYVRVPDDQLNAFSTYVVQDMEQADQIITISLVTLLLIIILIVLLV